MDFSQLITLDLVVADLPGKNKEDVLLGLASLLSPTLAEGQPGAGEILQLFMERESLGTTGIGDGIAVPHGRISNLTKPVAVLARSLGGIEFGALDGEPVHLLVGLLSPKGTGPAHLDALSAISRLFRQKGTRRKLLSAQDREAMFQIVLSQEGPP